MTSNPWQLTGTVSLVTLLAAGSASAQSSSVSAEQIDKLQAQIQTLQRELQAMKRKVDAAPAPAPTAIVKMSPENRPSICTADGRNCISFLTLGQLDVGGYNYRPNTGSTVPQHLDDGINSRRARIGIGGTFLGDWNYTLIYDFGGSSDGFGGTVASASTISSPPGGTVTTTSSLLPGGGTSGIEQAVISYVGFKPFAIEGGYMSIPWTLDQATGAGDLMFIERASSNTIATSVAAGDFRSAVGVRATTDQWFAAAYFTGPVSGLNHAGSTTGAIAGTTEQYGAIARLTYQLLTGSNYSVHIGGNAEVLLRPPHNPLTGAQTITISDRPELRIDPTSILTTGAIASVARAEVYGAEAAAGYGPFFVQGEYFWYNVDRQFNLPSLNFQGGYVEASWTLTGESRKYLQNSGAYSRIFPTNPFSITGGGWGAWEIAGRYSTIDLNDRIGFSNGVAGGQQTIWAAALNWYPNANVRFMLNYLHGTVDKTASAVSATDTGAKFDAVALRSQVQF